MFRPALALIAAGLLAAEERAVVFRSEVALMRIDVQVLDRSNHPVLGLKEADFLLYEQGQPRKVTAVEADDMPVDVVLLLDVSGSMRRNIQLVADASQGALGALAERDRVAVMVFDRATRVRLPFSSDKVQVRRGLQAVIDQETFDGGTDIPRAISDASLYITRNARKEARRAIVIVTDDQNERAADRARMSRSLLNADAVLSVLLAPDAMRGMGGNHPGGGTRLPRRRGSTWPGGGWPGGGGAWPPVIIGPGGGQGPVVIGGRTQPAGTPELARETGGDSMPVDDAGALADTLERIRQRYALHFQLPPGAKAGEERRIEIQLSANAARRYPGAELRYRKAYLSPGSTDAGDDPETEIVTAESQNPPAGAEADPERERERPTMRRRPNVSEPSGPKGPNPALGGSPSAESGGEAPATEAPKKGGWRVLKPGEQP
jgi:VWFA-related protein